MISTHELAPGLFLQSIMEWMIKAGFDLDWHHVLLDAVLQNKFRADQT
jgi:hypothetical protein